MDEFVSIARDGKTALVDPRYCDAVADALLDGKGCVPAGLGGRGELLRFEFEGGTGLVRPYRRGGLVRYFLRDGYWFVNRPLRELMVHRQVHALGLSVPVPLGVCWQRRGVVYRGAIATQELDGVDLLEFVRRGEGGRDRVLWDCGRLIRAMHDAGVYHSDLQVRNVVVTRDGNYLIDFDKARLKPTVGRVQRARNLLRLGRSMEKNGVALDCIAVLWEGYGGDALPRWLVEAYRFKAAAADFVAAGGRMTLDPPPESVWLERRGPDVVQLTDGVSVDAVLHALKEPGEVLKESPKRITRRVGEWVVKASVPGGGVDVLKCTLQRGRRRRAWKAALHLKERGIGVPAPRAFVEHGRLGIVWGHAMVSDFLEGCVNVEVYGRGLVEKGGDGGDVSRFLARLADAVNALNDAGAYHGDLSGKNILTADGESFYFIDLDSVLLGQLYGWAKRMKNHVQLYDSFCDVIDGEVLGAFIVRMVPSDFDQGRWIEEVREGQQQRRHRQQEIWKKQGTNQS